MHTNEKVYIKYIEQTSGRKTDNPINLVVAYSSLQSNNIGKGTFVKNHRYLIQTW